MFYNLGGEREAANNKGAVLCSFFNDFPLAKANVFQFLVFVVGNVIKKFITFKRGVKVAFNFIMLV